MANLIFVHGAFANNLSWFDVPSHFSEDHAVTWETLPGHGDGPDAAVGLDDYVSQVSGLLSDSEPNWLIGHSMGGMVISQVAANLPDKVTGLIYIAAVLPKQGQNTLGISGLFNPQDAFPNHDREEISHGFASQPLGALNDSFSTSPGFADVAKHYFVCAQDNVIAPDKQRAMVAAYGNVDARTLASDHLPMHASDKQETAHPELLAGLKEILS